MSLEQLYQQIILEHAKLRTGSGLAETPVPAGAVVRAVPPAQSRLR